MIFGCDGVEKWSELDVLPFSDVVHSKCDGLFRGVALGVSGNDDEGIGRFGFMVRGLGDADGA